VIPVADVWDHAAVDPRVREVLKAASRSPVHAYLLLGPPGVGKRRVARCFAASLLCPRGGCGECEDCRSALSGRHPDLVVRERSGPFITVADAREVSRLAWRSPVRAPRQVLVLNDFHLVDKAAPALLKTIEEPAGTTTFVVLADHLAPELVTIASRCAVVELPAMTTEAVGSLLVAEGVEPEVAGSVAAASGANADRARRMASDPASLSRLRDWSEVPARLDGTGAAVASITDTLLAGCEQALEPVRAAQATELEQLAEATRLAGERGVTNRRELEDRHRREQRRVRSDELRAGLDALAGAYRDRMVAFGEGIPPGETKGHRRAHVGACLAAVKAVGEAVAAMERNPNEVLLLQSLLLELSELAPDVPLPASAVAPGGPRGAR
jgi:DNA polymerase III subunit delta'